MAWIVCETSKKLHVMSETEFNAIDKDAKDLYRELARFSDSLPDAENHAKHLAFTIWAQEEPMWAGNWDDIEYFDKNGEAHPKYSEINDALKNGIDPDEPDEWEGWIAPPPGGWPMD